VASLHLTHELLNRSRKFTIRPIKDEQFHG
jgi:hypothetical protein